MKCKSPILSPKTLFAVVLVDKRWRCTPQATVVDVEAIHDLRSVRVVSEVLGHLKYIISLQLAGRDVKNGNYRGAAASPFAS